jgi:hypothetical protein
MKTTIMKYNVMKTMSLVLALFAAGGLTARAQDSDLDKLKANMEQMQKNMEEMQKKIADLEREKTATAAAMARGSNALVETSASVRAMEKIAAGGQVGTQSPVASRGALNDQQDAAPRSKDHTLDPKYNGFVPVPNTGVLVKFNAKPRVDMMSDNRNAGNPDRFVTATIPVTGDLAKGGDEQFNANARGSSLSFDVRAPEMAGDFRFYYNNDFFGSGSGMQYRLKHLYGQFYNVTAGFTYSCFEDPDAWPDTVDFEGPNAVIFARRALVRYMLPLGEEWQMNFGVEAPGAEVDGNSTADTINSFNHAPDGTLNLRWERSDVGHVQFGAVMRSIGAHGPIVGDETVFGWGLNLAGSFNVFHRDSVQAQLTYGEGIFRYINDDFVNNDAAFNASGNLEAIPCLAATIGYTHRWNDVLRSTATYGFVNLENEATQGAAAYDQTHYASLNLVWQLRKRLSVGAEVLYGRKETQGGQTGEVVRFQLGMVYSLFD